MIAFENMNLTFFTGVFPNTAAINSTAPNLANGTPLVAAILNDEWGVWQQILQMAGQTPSGIGETAAASANAALGPGQQKIGALQMVVGLPGSYVFDSITPGSGTYGSQSMAWGAASGGPPTRYQGRRVLPCQGQVITIANYPDLCAAVYCGDGNNPTAPYFYKTTSTSSPSTNRSTSGAYMVIADCRGLTLRGFDPNAVHDPQGASRLLASLQQDAIQGHVHAPSNGNSFWTGAVGSAGTIGGGVSFVGVSFTGSPVTDGTNGTPRTAPETRMYNFSCNIGICY